MKKLSALLAGLFLCLITSLTFAAELGPFPKFTAFDSNGDPLSGGQLFTYHVGTSSKKDTFTTYSGGVANTNPVILDTNGQADVWLSGCYRMVLKDSSDVTQWTVDRVCGSDVGEINSSTTGYVAVYSGTTEIEGVATISGASTTDGTITGTKIDTSTNINVSYMRSGASLGATVPDSGTSLEAKYFNTFVLNDKGSSQIYGLPLISSGTSVVYIKFVEDAQSSGMTVYTAKTVSEPFHGNGLSGVSHLSLPPGNPHESATVYRVNTGTTTYWFVEATGSWVAGN